MVEVTDVDHVRAFLLKNMKEDPVQFLVLEPVPGLRVIHQVDGDTPPFPVYSPSNREALAEGIILPGEDGNVMTRGTKATGNHLSVDLGARIVEGRIAVDDLQDAHRPQWVALVRTRR